LKVDASWRHTQAVAWRHDGSLHSQLHGIIGYLPEEQRCGAGFRLKQGLSISVRCDLLVILKHVDGKIRKPRPYRHPGAASRLRLSSLRVVAIIILIAGDWLYDSWLSIFPVAGDWIFYSWRLILLAPGKGALRHYSSIQVDTEHGQPCERTRISTAPAVIKIRRM
jgi:hypothetical protein